MSENQYGEGSGEEIYLVEVETMVVIVVVVSVPVLQTYCYKVVYDWKGGEDKFWYFW